MEKQQQQQQAPPPTFIEYLLNRMVWKPSFWIGIIAAYNLATRTNAEWTTHLKFVLAMVGLVMATKEARQKVLAEQEEQSRDETDEGDDDGGKSQAGSEDAPVVSDE